MPLFIDKIEYLSIVFIIITVIATDTVPYVESKVFRKVH